MIDDRYTQSGLALANPARSVLPNVSVSVIALRSVQQHLTKWRTLLLHVPCAIACRPWHGNACSAPMSNLFVSIAKSLAGIPTTSLSSLEFITHRKRCTRRWPAYVWLGCPSTHGCNGDQRWRQGLARRSEWTKKSMFTASTTRCRT